MGFSEKRMSLVDTLERPKAFKAELEFFLRRKVTIKLFAVSFSFPSPKKPAAV